MRATLAIAAAVVGVGTGIAHADPETGRVTGTISVVESDGKPASPIDAIVYIVGFSEKPAAGAPMQSIAQSGRRFVPDLIGITAGETVHFPNNDPFLHNVFSQSAARKFDLGSYKKGDAKDKDFPEPGVVDVYCNIHPEMAATILVLPNNRHTRTSATGEFAIDGVPVGEWTVFAYTRRAAKPVSAKVSVTAHANTQVHLDLARGAEPAHPNKFGEAYRTNGSSTYH